MTATDKFYHSTSLYARFQQLTPVWVIDQSPLLDRVYAAAYLSTYVIPNLPYSHRVPLVTEDAFVTAVTVVLL